jgi:hypothetical protein
MPNFLPLPRVWYQAQYLISAVARYVTERALPRLVLGPVLAFALARLAIILRALVMPQLCRPG